MKNGMLDTKRKPKPRAAKKAGKRKPKLSAAKKAELKREKIIGRRLRD